MFVISKIEKESLLKSFDKSELSHEIDVEGEHWYSISCQPNRVTAVNTQSYTITIGGEELNFDSLTIDLGYYITSPVKVTNTYDEALKYIENTGDHDVYCIDEVK